MNYIGSKFKLLYFLFKSISETIANFGNKPLEKCVFCDMFAGSCAVSKFFKDKTKQVIANDREFYSFVLSKNYVENGENLLRARSLIARLNDENQTPLIKGKIFTHYALGGGENRQYFSDYNAQKIDAIRVKIGRWHDENKINEAEFFFLLASLLESADKVANTASVYGAFLKTLKKSAQKKFILSPSPFTPNRGKNFVFQMDANELIIKIKGDILYLDPPYNAREYGANYHLLNTVALYDDFTPRGITGLREYEKSAWCKKNEAKNALENLIKNADFKFIFLSYNDEGILSLGQIEEILSKYGKYRVKSQIYQRFKADSNRTQKQAKTTEFLHILEKY